MTKRSSLTPGAWTRREWLSVNGVAIAAMAGTPRGLLATSARATSPLPQRGFTPAAEHVDAATWESIAQQAVDAARAAGAAYADARLTRTVQQVYHFAMDLGNHFAGDYEFNGLGVRALVNGYWGFAASPRVDGTTAARLAKDAVAQAKANALGTTRRADLARCAPVRGSWVTPMRIDPFTVPIEEKNDSIVAWIGYAGRIGTAIDTIRSRLTFSRQERVVATSEGALFSQRLYESAGSIVCSRQTDHGEVSFSVEGLQAAGKGWELILDANVFTQLRHAGEAMLEQEKRAAGARPVTVGRYTLVCDGTTMAALVDQTLGLATQLDRALGYEANASGTSYISNPLGSVGTLQVASAPVTITANRSAPAQLATVKWDDEGVEPKPFTIIKDGVLHDFQTTREQASWLAPYYQKNGIPVQSHGCAASENALKITMQHTPNLAMSASESSISVDDLIANVSDGLLMTGGVAQSDFQARTGLLFGSFQRIKNGRLTNSATGGAVSFNASDLWRKVTAVAGEKTRQSIVSSQYPFGSTFAFYGYSPNIKGQPQQMTSHTVTAPAATITEQAIIDPLRKA
jgi:TldD protein